MEYTSIPRDDGSFQKPLTAEQLKAMCVKGLGWDHRVVSIRELASGMFNNTYWVTLPDRKVILRVGPAPEVKVFSNELELLRREQSVEPFFAPVAAILPKTLFSDFTRKIVNRDFVFQTFIEGELWDGVKDTLPHPDHDSLWKQLGAIAKKIHGVRGTTFGFPAPRPAFDHWSDAVIGIAGDMIDDIRILKIDPTGTDEFLEMLDAGRDILDEIRVPHLVHGDLWPKNVLLERLADEVKITGLLDAERAFWGDPMAEWIFHDGTCAPAFWETYGKRPEDPGSRFRDMAYTGLYAVQLFLEAWRFKLDDTPFRERLRKATCEMKEKLP